MTNAAPKFVIAMVAFTLAPTICYATSRGVPSADKRLIKQVHIASSNSSLASTAAALSTQTGVQLTVDSRHRGLRDIIYASNIPARNVMIALAWAHHMTWRKLGSGYLLTQTTLQQNTEKLQVDRIVQRRALYTRLAAGAIANSLETFVMKNQEGNPVSDLIHDMDANTYNALCLMGTRQMAAYPVGGSAHIFRNYLFGVMTFRQLAAATGITTSKLYKFLVSHALRVPAFITPRTISGLTYGIFVYDGIVNFAVISHGNTNIWWTTPIAMRKYIPNFDINDDDTDPQVVKLLPHAHFDLTDPLPARFTKPCLHFTTSQYLPTLIKEFHTTTGATVICTRFINSIRTRVQGLLTYHDKFRLADAVGEVDRAFGYHSAWFGGMLVSRTTDPGANILNEPPAGIVTRMAKLSLGKGPMSLVDIRSLAALTHQQWTNLWWNAVAEKAFHQRGYSNGPRWRVAFMKLFGSLTAAQLTAAKSHAGIPAKQLTAAQRMQLILATDMGPLPLHPKPVSAGLQPGFYVHINGTPASVKTIQFIAAYPYLGKLRVTPWTFQAKMGQNDLSVASK